MTGVLRRIDSYWVSRAPAERLATLRILIGGFSVVYLLARLPTFLGLPGMNPADFRPIGVVALLDSPLAPWANAAITIAAIITGFAFVIGWRYRIVAPVFAVLLLWALTYRSSWGMIFHTENLLALHVLVLSVSRAADALSVSKSTATDPRAYGWPIRLLCVLTVITYLLAGIAKLRLGGLQWSDGEVLRNYIATDNLRKLLLGDVYSPIAVPLLGYESMFRGLAVLTLLLELGAPLALLGGRIRTGWVALVFGFHVGIVALMAIVFPYPLSGIGYASFFRVEKLSERAIKIARRWGPVAKRLKPPDP